MILLIFAVLLFSFDFAFGASVTWVCDRCTPTSGTATGTTNWTQAGIQLAIGVNVLTVTAVDDNGVFSTDTITVTYAPTPASPTLAGAWGFGEGSGTTTVDSSGNNNTGTLINSPTWTTQGHSDNAITFNGTNQYVQVNNTPSLQYTERFSFSAWVKPASVQNAWKSVISKNGIGGLYASSIDTGACKSAGASALWFFVNGTSGPEYNVCGPALAVGQWTHLEGTYDNTAGQAKLYVNGVLVTTISASGYIDATTQPLEIGRSSFGEYFHGDIDEVRTYNWGIPASVSPNTVAGAACGFTSQADRTNMTIVSVIADMNCPVIQGLPPVTIKIPASATGLKLGAAASGLKFGSVP